MFSPRAANHTNNHFSLQKTEFPYLYFDKNRFFLEKNDIMDEKTVGLIAVALVVTNRWEPCMSVHLNKAVSLARPRKIFYTILISPQRNLRNETSACL